MLGICITHSRILDKILHIACCNDMNEIKYLYPKCCENSYLLSLLKIMLILIHLQIPAGHYHGTSMTVLKFPLSTRPGKIRNIEYELTVCKILSKKVNKLPQSYTNVIQLNISKAPLFAPIFRYNIPECKPDVAEQGKEKDFYWLDSFSNCFQYDSCQPWSKYHG